MYATQTHLHGPVGQIPRLHHGFLAQGRNLGICIISLNANDSCRERAESYFPKQGSV